MTRILAALSQPRHLPVRPDDAYGTHIIVHIGELRCELWLTADEAEAFGRDIVAAAERTRRREWDR